MRKTTLALLSSMLLCLIPSQASPITGDEFQALPELGRRMYLVGTLDAWGAAVAANANAKETSATIDNTYGAISRCDTASKADPRQTLAIVDKHIRDNRERWDEPASTLIWGALWAACKP